LNIDATVELLQVVPFDMLTVVCILT